MNRRMVLTGLIAAALWAMSGCNDSGSTDGGAAKPRLALIMKARTNPFFKRMEEGARKAADELGADLKVWDLEKETDVAQQAAAVETAISQGVKAIIVAPADSKAVVAPLLQAQREGIKIINIDNRIDSATATQAGLKIATYIGPNNEEGARKSTAAMIEAIGGEGAVAMLEGIRGVDNADARKRGFLEAVEATGGKVEVVAMDTAEWATEPAQQKMEGFLSNHPEIKGVFCANDNMAFGAMKAIESAGKTDQIVVTAYDNLAEIHGPIREGKVHATIEQHPDKMGAMGVEYALKVLRGEEIEDEIEVPTDLITKADLE